VGGGDDAGFFEEAAGAFGVVADVEVCLGAGEGDVAEAALCLESFAARDCVCAGLLCAGVGEGAFVAGDEDDVGPLAAFGAVDGGEFDAVFSVAAGCELCGLAFEVVEVLLWGEAGGVLLGLFEYLALELVEAVEAVVFLEPLVESAADPQQRDCLDGVPVSASSVKSSPGAISGGRSLLPRRGGSTSAKASSKEWPARSCSATASSRPRSRLRPGVRQTDATSLEVACSGWSASWWWSRSARRAPRTLKSLSWPSMRTLRSAHASAIGRNALVVRARTAISLRCLVLSSFAISVAVSACLVAWCRLMRPSSAPGAGAIGFGKRTWLRSISLFDAATTSGGQR
jgi:hypothetical protein